LLCRQYPLLLRTEVKRLAWFGKSRTCMFELNFVYYAKKRFFLAFILWESCFVVEKKGCFILRYSFADKWIPYKIITSHHSWFGNWITVFGEQYKQWNWSMSRFILSLFRPTAWHYRLSTLFSSTLIFCFPVWQTGKTVVPYRRVLFIVFWGT